MRQLEHPVDVIQPLGQQNLVILGGVDAQGIAQFLDPAQFDQDTMPVLEPSFQCAVNIIHAFAQISVQLCRLPFQLGEEV